MLLIRHGAVEAWLWGFCPSVKPCFLTSTYRFHPSLNFHSDHSLLSSFYHVRGFRATTRGPRFRLRLFNFLDQKMRFFIPLVTLHIPSGICISWFSEIILVFVLASWAQKIVTCADVLIYIYVLCSLCFLTWNLVGLKGALGGPILMNPYFCSCQHWNMAPLPYS